MFCIISAKITILFCFEPKTFKYFSCESRIHPTFMRTWVGVFLCHKSSIRKLSVLQRG